ncbi:putative nucleoside 2-deoxyribosyltransferase protein, partial [Solidesulfovibrio fructosivorans JJ]]
MHIVGGLYHELCCVPKWDAIYGSGGRAASVLSTLSPNSTLHTYVEDMNSPGITSLRALGINLKCSPRQSNIVFSYFHPLSRPHIQPQANVIQRQPAIKVSGEAVLRFGFLEGDAVIDAHRAVYDPQTWQNSPAFSENESIASELAVVLNEFELQSTTGINELDLASSYLMESQDIAVIVVKRGPQGAMVFKRGCQAAYVPAYRSSRVFKIGTGDVFSAIFAHNWAERRYSALTAADTASRSVAVYCGTGRTPLDAGDLSALVAVKSNTKGTVALEGAYNTIDSDPGNRRNGYSQKELASKVGPIVIDVPRDRKSEFAPAIVKKR